eukprot:554951-Pyramimonas_sp.AAC.1
MPGGVEGRLAAACLGHLLDSRGELGIGSHDGLLDTGKVVRQLGFLGDALVQGGPGLLDRLGLLHLRLLESLLSCSAGAGASR